MGLRKNKEQTLRTLFIKYIFLLGILIMALAIFNFSTFLIASFGVYPANYSERMVEGNLQELKTTPQIRMDLLSPMSNFGVYSKDGEFIHGNLPSKYIEEGWDSYKQGKKTIGLLGYITSIEREEEILIISYPLSMQFKNEKIRKILPNAEITIIFLFFLQLFILIILWSNVLTQRINNELKKLLNAGKKIESQNLDFHVSTSDIKDINIILQGINRMKDSLQIALEKQWLIESQKKEQILALAHDIKTPLTIVKGNIGLLQETNMTEEQKRYCIYIEENNAHMEEYLKNLLLISREEIDNKKIKENVYIADLISFIKTQSKALGKAKNIDIITNVYLDKDVCIKGDRFEIRRALMNIITNAIDFSPSNSTITINSEIANPSLIIQIIDQGKGFSSKALKYGKNQFYMGDESRTKSEHTGLGLYIANSIFKEYNGELILKNGKKAGALVTVKIPL